MQLPGSGLVDRPLCLSLRTSIQANLRTVAEDRAAGDEAAAAQAQAQVDTDVAAARRIQHCGVDDLLAAASSGPG